MGERILVVHQGALGDVILSFPALTRLKREQGASLELLCRNQTGKVAVGLGIVDGWFNIDGARFSGLFVAGANASLSSFLKRYDQVILFSFSAEVEKCVGRQFQGTVIRIPPRPPSAQEIHVAHYLALALEKTGVLRKGTDGSEKILSWAGETSSENGPRNKEGLILLHPGAGSRRKRWALERFIALADELQARGREGLFLLGPAEMDLLLPLEAPAKTAGWQVLPTDDLVEVMDLFKKASCFIGNDSGLSHLAAVMGTPTIAVFGPASPRRWTPLGGHVSVLRGEVTCSPCFELGKENCKVPDCLSLVSVETVLKASTPYLV